MPPSPPNPGGARMCSTVTLLLAAATPCAAIGFLSRFEPLARPALERYVASTLPPASAVTWVADPPSACVQLAFWRWLAAAGSGSGQSSVLALPSHEPRDLRQLLEVQELLPPGYELAPLPDASPVPGVAAFVQPSAEPPTAPAAVGAAVANAHTGAWVERTLTPSGLRFCPYTASARVAGAGLEGYGVQPAPISYAHCGAATLPALLESFWTAAVAMLAAGEEGTYADRSPGLKPRTSRFARGQNGPRPRTVGPGRRSCSRRRTGTRASTSGCASSFPRSRRRCSPLGSGESWASSASTRAT